MGFTVLYNGDQKSGPKLSMLLWNGSTAGKDYFKDKMGKLIKKDYSQKNLTLTITCSEQQ